MSAQRFIGLISGTSRDGVDAALIALDDHRPTLLHALCAPYPEPLRLEVDRLVLARQRPSAAATERLDLELGKFFAGTALTLIDEAGESPLNVAAIGSHGQTVWHEPDGPDPVSLQLGSGGEIARRTGITTVTDFRNADLAVGGQGAPLAPLLHQALFASPDQEVAVLNLGGIANLTVLQPDGPVRGWDTGPANCLMDLWIQRQRSLPWDDRGAWAASGRVDLPLLARCLDDPYFLRPPPKSTGLETFNGAWLDHRLEGDPPPEDVQRTLLELTVQTIARDTAKQTRASVLKVCGGGVHNDVLLQRLQRALPDRRIESTADSGIDPDWVEATLFAWLAAQRLADVAQDTRSITGARRPVRLGRIHPGETS